MTNLVEMSGAMGQPRTMVKPPNIKNMTNFQAGILALKMFAKKFPHATMGDLANMAIVRMSGESPTMGKLSWNPITWIPAAVEGTGDVLRDAGHGLGDVWRTVWDSPVGEVAEDATRKAAGLAPKDREMESLIEKLGAGVKSKVGGLPVWGWAAIAGIGVMTLFLFKGKK